MKKIIITGGSGFLGSKLSEILSESGYEVLSLGRKKYDQLNPIRKDQLSNVVYVDCDLSSENLESIIKKVGWSNEKIYTLFHLAWGGETGLSDLNSMKQFENLSITLDLFESSQNLKNTYQM